MAPEDYTIDTKGVSDDQTDSNVVQVVEADQRLAEAGVNGTVKETHRSLKPRHIQLMAISGSIGTGLFVGTGSALAQAGPLALVLGYSLFGAITWMCFNAMGEMICYLPVDGSFLHFADSYVDRSFSFAMAIVYIWVTAATVAAEVNAVAGMVNFWNTSINNALWCSIALAIIFAVNLLGVKYFGEAEFYFSILKVLLILGLLLFTLITMCGGNPQHDAFGFRYWKNPGVFNEYLTTGNLGRFAAFWSTLVKGAYAYGGPDYLANAAAEAKAPRRVMPRVFTRVIYRLLVFYIGGVFSAGILVPYTDSDLGLSLAGAGSSPFVLAAVRLGISGLPHIINAVLLTSALSAGIEIAFSGSRSLYGFALAGRAPKIFTKTARGVPYVSVITICSVGLLSFLSVSNSSATVFNWITNLVGAGNLLNYGLMCIIHIRWYHAMNVQGKDREALPFRVKGQLYFSYFACFMYFLILATNGFAVFVKGHWNYQDFLFAYCTIPVFLVPYIGHIIYRRSFRSIPLKQVDVDTGVDAIEAMDAEDQITHTGSKSKFFRWLWG